MTDLPHRVAQAILVFATGHGPDNPMCQPDEDDIAIAAAAITETFDWLAMPSDIALREGMEAFEAGASLQDIWLTMLTARMKEATPVSLSLVSLETHENSI